MAKFEKLIPFILHFAAGVTPDKNRLPLEQQFELAGKTGWSNDPFDPGGPTMIDVTLNTYRHYRLGKGFETTTQDDLRLISFEEWKEILKRLFWDRWKADAILSPGIAHLLVDWVWASGPKTILNVQKLIGVESDGLVGPKTLAAINGADPEQLFDRLYHARVEYYCNCRGAARYLHGWLRRLKAIKPDGSFSY